jgi:hypothetical protein
MNWEYSRAMGVTKWVSWGAGCWVTWRKTEPGICHIGFRNEYLGTLEMSPEQAKTKLEQMHMESLVSN